MLLFEEDAVLVLLLDKANNPAPHDTRVMFAEFVLTYTETAGKRSNLLVADTHRAGKPGAAAPAPQAFESKSVFIPEFIFHKMSLSVHERSLCCAKKEKTLP
jgi:hypothetical protein